MIFNEIEEKLDDNSNKYELSVIAAKRSKQLNLGAEKTVETSFKNPASIGLYEVITGKVKYDKPKG